MKASEILTDASEVVYGNDLERLPEYLNGLGYMNILYLLLSIEIKMNSFRANNKDIKLLFIEEPEAHTHPQLQYIFAQKISNVLCGISGMQTIITTHSPHIVKSHPFKNIRYMSITNSNGFCNIEIKNFHEDLKNRYASEPEEFQFLQQYLSVESADLFFADKAIFIEGISEGMLMQYFIAEYDAIKIQEEKAAMALDSEMKQKYVPLGVRNVTVVQAGANAKAFCHFIDFLKIPTIIITDIDTTEPKQTGNGIRYVATAVKDVNACKTSNETIAYYLGAPKYVAEDVSYSNWFDDMVNHKITSISPHIYIAYQKEENNYYARSFEDAFININIDFIKDNVTKIKGLRNKEEFKTNHDMYELTQNVIDKKSDFASSLLFLAHAQGIKWNVPSYIKEGIEWLQKN